MCIRDSVLTVLKGHSFVYFTSNKSSILELCDWMDRNPFGGSPFKAVSYTHLDVYKRQERIRVTGIDREDDGTWLNRFMKMGGVDAEGNATDTCALVGQLAFTDRTADKISKSITGPCSKHNQPEKTFAAF